MNWSVNLLLNNMEYFHDHQLIDLSKEEIIRIIGLGMQHLVK